MDRAEAFFWARCRELASPTTPIYRRARANNALTILREVASIAEAHVRSGGATRTGASAEAAGHGVKMLPDVVAEAVQTLADDRVLARCSPAIRDSARELLGKFRDTDAINAGSVEVLRSYANALGGRYLDDAFDRAATIVRDAPRQLAELESVCSSLVSALRASGWTDETLERAFADPETNTGDFPTRLRDLRALLPVEPRAFRCFVAVFVAPVEATVRDLVRDQVVAALPQTAAKVRGVPTHGPYLCVSVSAMEPVRAAEIAFARSLSFLGALDLFTPKLVGTRSQVVAVEDVATGTWTAEDPRRIPAREPRALVTSEIERVAKSALATLDGFGGDALFEAIRHQRRASQAPDAESRLLLIWAGLERMCAGSPDHGTILGAARGLVPKAITLGKIRRDVAYLAGEIRRAVEVERHGELRELLGSTEHAGPIDRERLLDALTGPEDEWKRVCSLFYDNDPRLVQACWSLRTGLDGRSPAHVREYLERSRQRIDWHILRIYRARNAVTHAAASPAAVADLAIHAHYYLTQLVAIVIHHREDGSPASRSPGDILLRRAAQYDAFLALVEKNYPGALTARSLLRPTGLV